MNARAILGVLVGLAHRRGADLARRSGSGPTASTSSRLWAVTTIAAIGLNLTLGYAGQISLAQARLRRHRRLCGALLTTKAGRSARLSCSPSSSCFAIGWLLGYPALRVQHHYLAFVTLAFSTLVYLVFRNEEWITGGIFGISGHPAAGMFGYSLRSAARFLLFLPRQSGAGLARRLVADPLALGPRLRGAARKPGAGALARRRYAALYADGLRARRRRSAASPACSMRRSCSSSIRRRSRSCFRSICC